MKPIKKSTRYLLKNKITIATAESITGGMIASQLVNVPGISNVFNYGFVTYSDESKQNILGVPKSLICRHTAVSHNTARTMAQLARNKANADIGLASTGFAGPRGGTKNNPIGTVYLACAIDDYIVTRKYVFRGNRYFIRRKATNAAFKLLNDCIKSFNP